MQSSYADASAAARLPSNESTTIRLVIRAEILSEELPATVDTRSKRPLLAWIALSVALLAILGWIGFRALHPDAPVTPAASQSSPASKSEPLIPGPAPTDIERPANAAPPSQPLAATDEVIPQASRNALATIRGTIRVSIRVTIDPQGTVIEAAAKDRGPSRYFERLALEAAKQWRFSPAAAKDERMALVQFAFTRSGVTGHAEEVPAH